MILLQYISNKIINKKKDIKQFFNYIKTKSKTIRVNMIQIDIKYTSFYLYNKIV